MTYDGVHKEAPRIDLLPEINLCMISDFLSPPSMNSLYSVLPHRFNSASHILPFVGLYIGGAGWITNTDKEHEKSKYLNITEFQNRSSCGKRKHSVEAFGLPGPKIPNQELRTFGLERGLNLHPPDPYPSGMDDKVSLDTVACEDNHMDCDESEDHNMDCDDQRGMEELTNLLTPRLSLPPRECGQTLACDLLSKTLMGNLEEVLRRRLIPRDHALYDKPSPCVSTGGGIVSSFSALCRSLPPNSVCISGGSMVQAILGIEWHHSDIDIFCTMESAPRVRDFLVRHLNKTLVAVKSGYSSSAMFLSDDIVRHVEKYGNTPKNGSEVFHKTRPVGFHFSHEYATSKKTLSFTDSTRQQVIIRLDGDTRIPVEERLLDGLDASGGTFVNVDLVVFESSVGVVNAIQNTFDLEICKSAFDGVGFHIPNWTDTLQKRSRLADQFRNKLTLLYMKHLYNECKRPFRCVMLDLIDKLHEEYATYKEFLEEHHGLDEEYWRSLEADFNSKNIFSGYFDVKEIYARLRGKVISPTVRDLCSIAQSLYEVVSEIRKTLIHTSLYKVIEDSSYSALKERTISLIEVVDYIIDLINLDGPLDSVAGVAVGRLSSIVGDVDVGVMVVMGLYDDGQWDDTRNAWLCATGPSKADFLRKMLLCIMKQTHSGISDDTKYTHPDSVSAEQFQAKLRAMLRFGIYDAEEDYPYIGPFSYHRLLVKNVNRWMKYIDRGVDIGLEAVSIDQEWAVLSRLELGGECNSDCCDAWIKSGSEFYTAR
jgi:hypothetical protein